MQRGVRVIEVICLILFWMCRLISSANAIQEATPQKHDNAEARQLLAQAEQVTAKISGSRDQAMTLESIALAKAHAGDYEGARLIARALGTTEAKAKILKEMAVQQAFDGDPDLAVKTVGGIATGEDKVDAYSAIAEKLVEAHNDVTALSVMIHIADVKYTDDRKAIVFLLYAGHAFARAGAPEATSAMATQNTGKGPLWNDVDATLLVIAKAFNHDMTGARAKYAVIHEARLKAMALGSIGESQHIFGDKRGAAITYKELITLCQTIPDGEKLIVDVAQSQYENGDTADAHATINALLEGARNKGADELLAYIATWQAENDRDVEGATKTLALIKHPKIQAAVWQALAFAKARAGDVSGALAVAPKDADPYNQTEVLIGAARGILKALKPDDKP